MALDVVTDKNVRLAQLGYGVVYLIRVVIPALLVIDVNDCNTVNLGGVLDETVALCVEE